MRRLLRQPMDKKKIGLLLILCFVFFQLFSKIVSAEGSGESSFDIMYLAPIFLGFFVVLLDGGVINERKWPRGRRDNSVNRNMRDNVD